MTSRENEMTSSNGAAMAALLSAGLGSFALGALVLLNEAGVYAAPALYGPTGGLSGRSTGAVLIWLVAWAVLHVRWRSRHVAPAPVFGWTLALIAAAMIALFPPVWERFS